MSSSARPTQWQTVKTRDEKRKKAEEKKSSQQVGPRRHQLHAPLDRVLPGARWAPRRRPAGTGLACRGQDRLLCGTRVACSTRGACRQALHASLPAAAWPCWRLQAAVQRDRLGVPIGASVFEAFDAEFADRANNAAKVRRSRTAC
jgi:hypothetical protein